MRINDYVLQSYRGMAILNICPGCGQESLQRYVHKDTNINLSSEVGRCIRGKKCGYSYHPLSYFKENKSFVAPQGPQKAPSFIKESDYRKTLVRYNENNFALYLQKEFGSSVAKLAIENYSLGTSKRWEGSTIFWLKDQQNRIRTGRIILTDKNSGRITKQIVLNYTWVHYHLKESAFNAVECLFGSHLISKYPKKQIIIVMEETLAVVGSIFYPDYNWLASNGHPPNVAMCQGAPSAIWYPKIGFDKLNEFV